MNRRIPARLCAWRFAAAPIIPAYGWRSVFILEGILPLISCSPFDSSCCRNPSAISCWRNANPHGSAALLARMNPRLSFSSETSFVIHEHRAPGIRVCGICSAEGRGLPTLLMWIVFFVSLLDLFLMTNWLPTVFHDSGISVDAIVVATALFSGGGVIGAWRWERIIDRFGRIEFSPVNYFSRRRFRRAAGPVGVLFGAIMICTFFAGSASSAGKLEQTCWRHRLSHVHPFHGRRAGPWGLAASGPLLAPSLAEIMLSRHWPLDDRLPSLRDPGRLRQRCCLRDGPDTKS